MDGVPEPVFSQFMTVLKQSRVSPSRHAEYLQWLRYYLDFCDTHPLPDSKSDRVRLFCEKLRERNQTTEQQERAAHAVSLYFKLLKKWAVEGPNPATVTLVPDATAEAYSDDTETVATSPNATAPATAVDNINFPSARALLRTSRFNDAGYPVRSSSPEWDAVLERLAAEIKVRHYSRKTLKSYATWSRQFQHFLKNKTS